MPKGRAIIYSATEMAWLEERRLLPIAEYAACFAAAFDRHDITAKHLHALRKRMGWKTGRSGQFVKGQAPVNKGQPCPEGKGGRHPNARATQFRKGERRGVAVKLYRAVGSERISKDGYLERKIHDGLPLQSRWRSVHLVEWELVNGPLPAGHCLKCLDGNKLNTAPSNWECIPRSVAARLNGGRWGKRLAFDDAAPEVKPLVMAAAKVRDAASRARKGAAR